MASGGSGRRRKPSKDDDSPSLGTALAVGAAAAGIAALFYGAKKLYDTVVEEQAKQVPEYDDVSYQPPQSNTSKSSTSYSDNPRQSTVPRVLEPSVPQPRANLAEELSSYYEDYVNIPHKEMQRAQEIVDKVKQEVYEFLRKDQTELCVSSLINQDGSFEDLKVVAPDSFDLLIPVNLEQKAWKLVELRNSPTCYDIQKNDSSSASSFYDTCINDLHLSPNKVTRAMLECFLQGFSITTAEYQAKPADTDSTISLRVDYDGNKFLSINLFPAVCLHGTIVVASQDTKFCERDVWQETFFLREAQKLRLFDPHKCCHLECLKIVKAIALNHPAKFKMLSPYIYKNILLLMMEDLPDEDLWRHHSLQEQFVDMLNQLVYGFQAKRIPHYFNRRVNLLEGIPPEVCDGLVSFILNRIGKEKLHTLLVRDYLQA